MIVHDHDIVTTTGVENVFILCLKISWSEYCREISAIEPGIGEPIATAWMVCRICP